MSTLSDVNQLKVPELHVTLALRERFNTLVRQWTGDNETAFIDAKDLYTSGLRRDHRSRSACNTPHI